MAAPFDYTVNVPQPPEQNFLQSLLGIQQLKGLQQQSQLAQQQAAYQQEMHPLQIQQLEAQIAASKAAAAHSGESTNLLKTQSEAARFELAQKQDFQKSLNNLSSDPSKWTGDNFMELGIKFHQADPNLLMNMAKLRSGIPTKAQAFGDNLGQQLVLATQIGDTDTGKKLLKSGIKVAQDDPELTRMVPQLQQLSDQYNKFPEKTSVIAAMGLQMLSPEKANSMFKVLDERLKPEQTQAQIEEIRARTQKESGIKQADEEKRALDLEKERLQIQEIQQKLDAGRADKVKIYASQNKEGYKLNEEAINATLQADKANSILDKIDSGEIKLPSGASASIGQWVRDKVPFLANDITFLRTQYQGLLAPEAKKMLPPGSASDADMRAAREGLLNKNATPEQFRKAVKVIAGISEDKAKYAEARLGWISENEGSIGTAVKDINVFGVPVKKGTPLNAWWKNVGKDLDLNKLPTQASTSPAAVGGNPTDVDSILKQFGVK